MSLFSFIKKKKAIPLDVSALRVDVHSHLVPAIDDGIQSIEQGLDILREMEALGYEKVITTPHTMPGSFDNTPEIILSGLEKMKAAVKQAGINITMEAATEYYLDEVFLKMLENNEPLMTFGNNYVLFETGFMSPPPFMKEAIFMMNIKGYKPVYAHPERYEYLIQDKALLEEIIDRDVVFQMNLGSLAGAYGKPVQKFAEKLIDQKVVKLVGTDCHHMGHIDALKKTIQSKYFQKLMQLELLNNTL
ncbi:MAG: capsular polysaccharide biosynthesis protein [Roseivirga sp.]